MRGKLQTYFLLSLGACLLANSLLAASNINLGGRKDKVVTPTVRGNLLAVADQYLSKHDDGSFDAMLVELHNPYTFEKEREVEASEPVDESPEPVKPKVRVVYDEGAILDAVAKSFIKQIRGTMSMGGKYYIQLQKGSLMKPGAQFPVRLPEAREEPFTITLTEIAEDSFSLQVGEAVQSFPYEDGAASNGSIQIDED